MRPSIWYRVCSGSELAESIGRLNSRARRQLRRAGKGSVELIDSAEFERRRAVSEAAAKAAAPAAPEPAPAP